MNKHFVIHPDGTKSTRNSENRTYTHAIEMGPEPREARIAYVQRGIAGEQAQIARYQEAINYLTNGGQVLAVDGHWGITFHMTGLRKYATSYKDQQHGWSIHTTREMLATEVDEAREMGIANFQEYIKNCEDRIVGLTQKIADLEAGPAFLGGWGIVTWCGRYDLAQKQLDKWSQPGREVRIVETEMK